MWLEPRKYKRKYEFWIKNGKKKRIKTLKFNSMKEGKKKFFKKLEKSQLIPKKNKNRRNCAEDLTHHKKKGKKDSFQSLYF